MAKKVKTANNVFAFSLFQTALKADPKVNVFISPASVSIALAMTTNGAQADTRKAMAQALGLPSGVTLREMNDAYSELIGALAGADPKVKLEIANALWAKLGVTFKQPFLDRNKKFFGAEVTALDFDDEAASLARINGWCDEKTHGKIKRILDQIPSEAILYLVNAIYFKGPWTVEFDKKNTRERDFTAGTGATRKHPLMYQSGHYQYYRGVDFEAVSLPYASSRFSMYIVLPSKGKSLVQLNSSLTAENWADWLGNFHRTEGEIFLPRFKIEYETELSAVLSKLGMGVAFDREQANFRSMCVLPGENVSISQVKHKTFVEVNEEGTEAAAVTSVGMIRTTSIVVPRERFSMVVDRPFNCLIVDNETDTVLFIGAIFEPK